MPDIQGNVPSDEPLLDLAKGLQVYGIKLINGRLNECKNSWNEFPLVRICECCAAVGVREHLWKNYEKGNGERAVWDEDNHIVVGCLHNEPFPELKTGRQFISLPGKTTEGKVFKFLITWDDV